MVKLSPARFSFMQCVSPVDTALYSDDSSNAGASVAQEVERVDH